LLLLVALLLLKPALLLFHISGVLIPAEQAQSQEDQDQHQNGEHDGDGVPGPVRRGADRATAVAPAQGAGELIAARPAADSLPQGSAAIWTPLSRGGQFAATRL